MDSSSSESARAGRFQCSAKGLVAVTPVGGALAPGDLVVVGQKPANGPAGKTAGKKSRNGK